ncbi:MAG: rhodanese-like domain-containing protein [Bacteroidetes bacterium]|nr:rhodanese-like domain-containing protein [Bacteroidota bacterium]
MKPLSTSEAASLIDEGAIVIDTRPSAIFMSGFVPGSLSIPLSDRLSTYAELTLDPEYTVIIIAESGQEEQACRSFIKTGVVSVAGYIDGGYEAWLAAGGMVDVIIDIDAEEFAIDYKFDEFYLIDTRSDEQYEAEHVEYAESIPLSDIEENTSALNTSDNYYIYGATTEDAAFAASLFRRADFQKIRVISAGYDELKENSEITIIKKKKAKPDSNFSDN